MPAQTPIPFLDLPAQQKRMAPHLRARLEKVMAHCRFVMGPEVEELEQALAAFSGARHAIGVSSGTDALLLVMMGEGIGPGDAVFLPAFTYTATAEVVLLLGATPVFVDVDPETFQIDPKSLLRRFEDVQKAGTLRPAAVIGVDLFGQPAPWPALRRFAERQGLALFADCAQAFGGSLHGKKLGTEALATTLSFFPAKPLGAYGDGGAVLTDDPEKAALYRSLRSHGEGKLRYDVQRIGLNARLDTLQAAVLLAKMEIFPDDLKRRERVAQAYDKGLPSRVHPPERVPDSESAWAVYCVSLSTRAERDSLQEFLQDAGVPSAIYYPRPLHHQPAYAACHDGVALPVSERLGEQVLALPIHPDLTEDDTTRIVNAIQRWQEDWEK